MKTNRILTVILILSIVFVLSSPAIASNLSRQATLTYRDIKISLDGKEITPTDAIGKYVEPFIIDGTTYLPVRGISSALDLAVFWDSDTSTVVLEHPSPALSGYQATPDIIYTTSGTENGLGNTLMYIDGFVTRTGTLGDYHVIYIDDGHGELMLMRTPEISDNILPLKPSGHIRVYFVYSGMSGITNTPAGIFIGYTDTQNNGQKIPDAIWLKYMLQ